MKEFRTVVDHPSKESLNSNVINLEDPPLVSFCIPTFNNEDTIKQCLESYAQQDYPHVEIVVVDNGSTDSTVKIAREYADEMLYKDGGIGSVRQASVKAANGEIIGLFDSDIVLPHDNWLSTAVQYFNYSDNVSTVWPKNVAPADSPPTTHAYFELWDEIVEDRIQKDRGPFGGGNSLFRRDALEEIGGVDESLHYVEDLDWAKKLRKAGYQVVYIREPIHHYTMLGFGTFARKQLMSAEQFTRAGGEVTDLPVSTIVYEQVVLGTIGMIKGLLNREYIWLLFPALVLVRAVAFANALVNLGLEKFGKAKTNFK